MSARADVNILTQIGVEDPAGTQAAADMRLPSIDIEISPEHQKQFFHGAGYKFNTIGVMNKNWAMGSFKGPLSYTELAVILASYSNYAAPANVGTGGKGWTFAPGIGGTADTIKTYTIERGDSEDAAVATNGIFNSLDIEVTRETGNVAGEVLAKLFSVGNTLTATPTTIDNTPVSMNDMSIYLDSTSAGLGGTKLTDVFRLSIKLPKKYDLKWVIDAAQTSWADIVEQYMTPKLTLEAEFTSQMRTLYNTLKADNVGNYFLRSSAVGNNIGAGADYTFQGDFALQFTDAKEQRKGNGDVYAYNFEFEIMADTTWGKAWEIYLINALADIA
jgi:hypothetical protein